MKRIRTELTYSVPHWAFCNCDRDEMVGIPKKLCKFCVKKNGTYVCLLHDETLYNDDGLINKTQRCKEATAGYRSVIVSNDNEPSRPTVDPKDLIKQSIDMYTKTINDLLNQGYPRPLAESAARKYLLGN